MRAAIQTLKIFAQLTGGAVLLVLAAGLSGLAGFPGPIGMCVLVLLNWSAIYAFLRYRQGRQDELAQVLTAAVGSHVPVARAVQSYLFDRPRRGEIDTLLTVVAGIALPLYTYVRLCVGWWRFDTLVDELADRLLSGQSLSEALAAVPGVVSREFRLAAAVGEATGSLGPTLRTTDRERWSADWLDLVPRILYPFLVFVFVSMIAAFLMVYIVPRFHKIFAEFGEPFPFETQVLVDTWNFTGENFLLVPAVLGLGLIAVAAVIAISTVRWYTPFVGRLYRMRARAEFLRALGRLLVAERTIPLALEFLGNSGDLPPVVRRRVATAAVGIGRGDPLADALERAGLLPSHMAPLVRSAERVHTLPLALGELGDRLAVRAARAVRRAMIVASPLLVIAVGAVVGFIAVAMFLPLIHLLTRLSE
ncbi:type II secretion system F family protein [Fimbriiglobus ruber]|uniref:Putative secretion system X protein GspF-like n=1 Tax=Fimbriiglobus ruber TaxID=1908690 RepID=A0A225E075_9BACT|nr:type II secretion system F family protein [Fimbriiglobus ruber]OWK47001.1 putative secretion system X protein GspF-like [Fimbriiglobus ruber]